MATGEDRAQWEKNLDYYIQGVNGEIGQGYDFTIVCNSKRFVVAVWPGPLPDDQTTSLLSRYSKAVLADDEEEIQNVQDKIDDIIYEAGWQRFARLAPAIENGSPRSPIDLHSRLNPETFYFRLVIDGENTDIVQESPPPPKFRPFHLDIKFESNLPRYSAREVFVAKKLPGTGFIAKVSVNGQDMCCKVGTPIYGKAVQREYECLQKIAVSKHASSIRAPKLIGFIFDDDGGIIGILEEFIPHARTLGRMEGIQAISGGRRRKWAEQIRQSIDLLHEIGVVWGDGKPDNILINSETDDSCLVDFGGSFTDGWVDVELKETCRGDEQAVKKIIDFLAIDELLEC
ncbi:Protein kinase-like (PK-like) [Venustampulla echinocandica]|uniref:Protein kinase-like (PK-like) n=1 Tax=Venustampulla echinocandica TaxID=2656787 RepID=A0A370TA73_9HELO|nr:Protein kinase-like (PK-like) [Venustampulla echinocandica]RDL30717.1 Protein kinase-like (PK-like) [Venustampulla echinocandica]